jgi:hypothetical protein
VKNPQEQEIAELRRQIRELKKENFNLKLNSSINLATAMVMSEEFGYDLEVYKKKAVGMTSHTP